MSIRSSNSRLFSAGPSRIFYLPSALKGNLLLETMISRVHHYFQNFSKGMSTTFLPIFFFLSLFQKCICLLKIFLEKVKEVCKKNPIHFFENVVSEKRVSRKLQCKFKVNVWNHNLNVLYEIHIINGFYRACYCFDKGGIHANHFHCT